MLYLFTWNEDGRGRGGAFFAIEFEIDKDLAKKCRHLQQGNLIYINLLSF